MNRDQQPRPPRMYTDAERNQRPRLLWDISHWIDWVESGASRPQRRTRLAEVPQWARDEVTHACLRRAASALARARRESRNETI